MSLILSAVPIILSLVAYPRKTKELNIFCYPISIIVIGVIAFLTLLFGTVMMWVQNPHNWVTILLTCSSVPLYLGFMYLIISSICFRVELYDTFLVYRNNIGIRRRFDYSDITKIQVCYKKNGKDVEQYKIFIGGKLIKINYLMLNFKDFLKHIKHHLKKNKCPCDIETK